MLYMLIVSGDLDHLICILLKHKRKSNFFMLVFLQIVKLYNFFILYCCWKQKVGILNPIRAFATQLLAWREKKRMTVVVLALLFTRVSRVCDLFAIRNGVGAPLTLNKTATWHARSKYSALRLLKRKGKKKFQCWNARRPFLTRNQKIEAKSGGWKQWIYKSNQPQVWWYHKCMTPQ